MDKKVKKTWLWLDDEPDSVNDIEMSLRRNGIAYKKHQNLSELFSTLISIKNENKLSDYGLIIDIMIWGIPTIAVPREWHGIKDERYIYHQAIPKYSGVTFYEKVILENGKSIWSPPPPVLFLSTMYEDLELQNKIKNIKELYMSNLGDNTSTDDARVKFIRKWDFDCKELSEL